MDFTVVEDPEKAEEYEGYAGVELEARPVRVVGTLDMGTNEDRECREWTDGGECGVLEVGRMVVR